jgi:allantoinase
MKHFSPNLLIHSRRVVYLASLRDATIFIKDGIIADVVDGAQRIADCPFEDFGDLVVMPGLVDSHVHLNEPGRTEWEGFETGTKAAAAGGITTLVDMPLNSSPVTTTVDALEKKIAASEGKRWVDCGFHAGLIPGNHADIEPLIEAGVLGVKAFLIHSGIDDFPNATERDLRAAMPIIAKHNIPLLVHAELKDDFSYQEKFSSDPRSYTAYLASRPREWEHRAIKLMIDLCREYGCRVHIVHLSSADALPMLAKAREEKLPITVETCPHYLFFAAEEIPDGDTRFKCAPPIREKENQERLWAALRDATIDFIPSDHSPCPPEMKLLDEGDFIRAWGGIASLQFGLSIMWTAARERGFSTIDLTEWMCRAPAAFIGLGDRKGKIAAGYDADLVAWNPEAQFTAEPSMIHHHHKVTPYEGQQLYGVVEKTFLRGTKIYERGRSWSEPSGKVLIRSEKLP